tara:strand:+ start:1047 stop:1424 length:378 start_codon:yes stop_codon:yes gene_type:complete
MILFKYNNQIKKSYHIISHQKITMVKKLTPDGSACRKCLNIESRLKKDNLFDKIDNHLYVNNIDGNKLAIKYNINTVPFFIVESYDENGNNREDIYTVYMKMKKDIFNKKILIDEAIEDIAISIL